MGRVAALAVPHFADWCAADMLDGRRPETRRGAVRALGLRSSMGVAIIGVFAVLGAISARDWGTLQELS